MSCPEKIDTRQKYHETVETLDTVVVSTNLENYAQSVSRVLKISCDQIDQIDANLVKMVNLVISSVSF